MFFVSSRRRHTRWPRDWSSDVCSSDLLGVAAVSVSPQDGELEHVGVEAEAGLVVVDEEPDVGAAHCGGLLSVGVDRRHHCHVRTRRITEYPYSFRACPVTVTAFPLSGPVMGDRGPARPRSTLYFFP